IRRIPIWATLIGLEEAGEGTAGVVFNPGSNEMLWAPRGDGGGGGGGGGGVCGDGAPEGLRRRDHGRGHAPPRGPAPAAAGRLLGPVRADGGRLPAHARLRRLLRLRARGLRPVRGPYGGRSPARGRRPH